MTEQNSSPLLSAFLGALGRDPARPALTWYDDRTGERVELSFATLGNWVAKTANLLVDGCALEPGAEAAVLLPPHWQTAAVLLGAWRAGVAVALDSPPHAVDVVFATTDRVADGHRWPAGDRFALGFAPLGGPLRDVPDGFTDYIAEVRGHGDHFPAYARIGGNDPALTGPAPMTHAQLAYAAEERGERLGLLPGARVLVDAAAYPDPLDWLAAPLLHGASIVLCGHLDRSALAARIDAERVTVALAS